MAVDTYLNIDTVKGESQAKGFEKQIEVLAWSWGASQTGSFNTGSGGGGAGKVNVNDISITKYLDKASTVLLKSICTGAHFKEAKLTCRKAGGKSPVDFLVIKLENVLITGLSTGGSRGEELVTENITLNFEKFEVTYTGQKPDGTPEANSPVSWNISKNAEK